MNTYALHGYFRSTTTWRVRIALALKGIVYDTVPVHLLQDGGRQYSAAYKARNPMAEVPTLEVRGPGGEPVAHIAQSVAILEFLEEVHPAPALLPATPMDRAKVRQLVEVVNSSIHPVQNLKVMRTLSADFGTERSQNLDWARRWIERHFVGLEVLVSASAGAHAFGDTISLADVAIIPQVYNALRFGADMSAYPTLARIDAAASALPAFKAAVPEAQPDFA